jgi:hypothetical protein
MAGWQSDHRILKPLLFVVLKQENQVLVGLSKQYFFIFF